MSCYLHNLEAVLKEAGIELTKENRKDMDKAVQRAVGVENKHCPEVWKAVKVELEKDRDGFVERLKKEMS